ncbi:MAG: filamentous hemagglutinin N-terminal domain-containing protein [Planctomycetota bacterium]
MKRFLSALTLLAAACGLALPAAAQTNGRVVEGSATLDTTTVPRTTVITTQTQRTILEFDSFNLPNSRAAVFNQPTSNSAVLNRITNGAPTNIQGTVTSNGQVYFVNPAGVSFSKSAVVNVGRLVAAAGNLDNADFLSGRDRFTDNAGLAQNLSPNLFGRQGVTLVGRNVINRGNITADNGTIVLVSGKNVFLQEGPDNQVLVQIEGFGSTSGINRTINDGRLDPGPQGEVFLGAGDLLGLTVLSSGSITGRRVTLDNANQPLTLSAASSAFPTIDPDTAITVNASSLAYFCDLAPNDRLTLNAPNGFINLGSPDPLCGPAIVNGTPFPGPDGGPGTPGVPGTPDDLLADFTFVDAYARALPADALAVAAVRPATIDAGQAAAFRQNFSIDVKTFEQQPLLEYLVTATVLNDLTPTLGSAPGSAPGSGVGSGSGNSSVASSGGAGALPGAGGSFVSADRLDYLSAQAALDAYRRVFYTSPLIDPTPDAINPDALAAADGDRPTAATTNDNPGGLEAATAVGTTSTTPAAASVSDESERVRALIQQAADRYMADRGVAEIDPAAFVRWLQTQDRATLDALAGLDELVNQAMPNLGLGASELDRFKRWTYGRIAPQGVTLRTLDELIASAGQR